MKRLSLIILISALGCKEKKITIKDLTFADYEREAIALNGIDSTYIVAKRPLVEFEKGRWMEIGVGSMAYDTMGRVVFNRTELYSTYWFNYDTAGILNHIEFSGWDLGSDYSSVYKFNSDSLLLRQQWTDLDRGIENYLSIFNFNKEGQLTAEFNNDHKNMGDWKKETYRRYSYENSKLEAAEEKILVDDSISSVKNLKLFYSKDGRLDSTKSRITQRLHHGYYEYTMTTFYDKRGLKSKSILMDTVVILYRHTIRGSR